MRTQHLTVLALLIPLLLPWSSATLRAADAPAAGPAAGEVKKIIETGADVPWSQGLWVSAPGQVRIVEDAPPSSDLKKCLEVEVAFPGKGFMFYNAEPDVPLVVPGKLKSLSVWCKGEGAIVTLVDGWGRSEVAGKKLEWSLGKGDGWRQATFAIPDDWVQPIRVSGVSTHNWDFQNNASTVSIRLSRLEATYDLSDTDPATGALKSWKPDLDGSNSGLFGAILPPIARDPAADAFLVGIAVAGARCGLMEICGRASLGSSNHRFGSQRPK